MKLPSSSLDNIVVGTTQLDILSGNNVNMIYLVTSNTQHTLNTNYFNLLTATPKNLINNAAGVNRIKFTI